MNWRETPATLSRACDEQPVVFTGPKGALHGIFTPPAPDVPPARACVVFPGRPRSGLRRHLVLAARILAAEGFAVLRFDLRGRGESAGEVERPSRTEPRGEDVVAAIRHLREAHGQKQFLLAGYCYDALTALDSFKDEADAISGIFVATPTVLTEKLGGLPAHNRGAPRHRPACAQSSSARAPRRYWTVSRFPSERSRDRMRALSFSTQSRTVCARSSASPRRFCSRSSIAKRASGSKSRSGPVAFIPSRARPPLSSVRYHGSASFIPREVSATIGASRFSRAPRSLRSMPTLPSFLDAAASRHGARPALSMDDQGSHLC